jgi:hypothetical protein
MQPETGTTAEPADGPEARLADTPWALLDKHVLADGLRIPPALVTSLGVVVWLAVVAWLLLQDNGAGRLDKAGGWTQYVVKASSATGLVLVAVVILLIVGRAASAKR